MKKIAINFYLIPNFILKWWKQQRCQHKWLPKGDAIDNKWGVGYFHEHRCPKCKLIKQTHKIK